MFKCEFKTDSIAFKGADDDFGSGPEAARILRSIADRISSVGIDEDEGSVRDFNGNTVGSWELTLS